MRSGRGALRERERGRRALQAPLHSLRGSCMLARADCTDGTRPTSHVPGAPSTHPALPCPARSPLGSAGLQKPPCAGPSRRRCPARWGAGSAGAGWERGEGGGKSAGERPRHQRAVSRSVSPLEQVLWGQHAHWCDVTRILRALFFGAPAGRWRRRKRSRGQAECRRRSAPPSRPEGAQHSRGWQHALTGVA